MHADSVGRGHWFGPQCVKFVPVLRCSLTSLGRYLVRSAGRYIRVKIEAEQEEVSSAVVILTATRSADVASLFDDYCAVMREGLTMSEACPPSASS